MRIKFAVQASSACYAGSIAILQVHSSDCIRMLSHAGLMSHAEQRHADRVQEFNTVLREHDWSSCHDKTQQGHIELPLSPPPALGFKVEIDQPRTLILCAPNRMFRLCRQAFAALRDCRGDVPVCWLLVLFQGSAPCYLNRGLREERTNARKKQGRTG